MDPLEEIRQRLECQVNEFFNPYTSNERKQQIESMLESFSKQHGSWKQALYFLSRPQSFSNEYLVMYCLTVIENSVKNRWLTMSAQEKTELQGTLYSFLLQHAAASSQTKCPNFIRNKIIKVLTDVGKFSWPREHPEFLENVLKVTANDDTVVIGLLFLKTISEEWSSCKDEVSTDRKLELRTHLVADIKRIFELLHRILVAGLKFYCTASPSGQNQSTEDGQFLSPVLREIIALALQTCAHLCTWIPFDGSATVGNSISPDQNQTNKGVPFTTDFLRTLCQYALVDTTGSVNESDGIENLSILSLNVLNELLYRKFVPKELDAHINLVINFGVDLLNIMSEGIAKSTVRYKYLDKGVEFLCLIANAYFFRFNQPTAKSFTTLLLPFTFAQTETIFYYECLEIWKLLLDHLISEVPFANIAQTREELLDTFKPILLDLALGIVNSTKKFELPNEDDEYFNDEDEEDVEVLSLSKNIDVLVKIGELLPTESLERVTSTWTTSCQYFESLLSKLDESKTAIMIENPVDIKHFSFVVQLIGRIAEIFYGDVFKNELERGKALFHQLIGLMMISKNFYLLRNDAVIQANCEIVYSLRTWIYWLGRYYSEVIIIECSPAEAQNFYDVLSASSDGLCFVLDNRQAIHPSIVLAHANFFALLVNCVRSQFIFKLPWVQTLIDKSHTLKDSLSADTFRVVNKGIGSLLLLPWQSTSEQEWELRGNMYCEFMKRIMGEMQTNKWEPRKLHSWILVINDQLDNLRSECAMSKKICWGICQEFVQFMHKLVPVHILEPAVNEDILDFFLKIMEVLRQQAGTQFFEDTVRLFLSQFTTANIITDLMKEKERESSSSIVVEKFLQMLEFMVKDPSPTLKKLLPDCLSVALDHIYPVLAQRSSPDAKLSFFQFVRDTVNFRWNYFFPGYLYASQNQNSSSASNSPSSVSEEDLEVSRRLKQIFETIGQSFLQSDLEVFRFNLNTLSVWNQRHQIYSRILLDPKMFDGFMSVLIQVLASKSHDLLKEEISFNLYEMSLVDYTRFWQVFLPQTLQNDFPLLNSNQRMALANKFKPKTAIVSSGCGISSLGARSGENIDLSGFSITLFKFIDDLRYFHFYTECLTNSKPQQPGQSSGGSADGSSS